MFGNLPISLLGGLAAGELSEVATQARRKALIYAAVAIIAITAWTLAVAAAVFTLAVRHGPPVALLGVAAVLCIFAVTVIIFLRYNDRLRRERNRGMPATKAMLATAAVVALPSIVRKYPLLVLGLVGGGLTVAYLNYPGNGNRRPW